MTPEEPRDMSEWFQPTPQERGRQMASEALDVFKEKLAATAHTILEDVWASPITGDGEQQDDK